MNDVDQIVAELTGQHIQRLDSAVLVEEPGFYAWWAHEDRLGDAQPPIPVVRPPGVPRPWSLLYVGICPKQAAGKTDRNLAARIAKEHSNGNIGGSTFRLSLASLLRAHLGLVALSGHDRARVVNERPLTNWISENCGLTLAVCARPWACEADVIRRMCPPLNLRPGSHDFRDQVSSARGILARDCGCK